VQKGVAAHARKGFAGSLTGGKGAAYSTTAEDKGTLRRREDSATLPTSMEDDAMQVKEGWAVGVATMLLILGTPNVSIAESTISFSSRYYYFCWNPGANGNACSQRSSKKIWMASHVPVEVELRAVCKQSNYTNMFYAPDERKVIETFDEDCGQGAKQQRIRRETQEERARQEVPK
jgi:hypothetical protein